MMSTAKSGPAPPAIAEVARLWLAPPVALLASCLALVCLTSVPDVVTDLEALSAANERFVGWAGVGLIVALAVAAVGVLTAPRVGPGPALSLGAAAAVFGLALGSDIVDDLQAGLAFCLLGVAVGGLVSGAACMSLELDGRWRSASLIAWVVPLAAGWPMVTWVALHDAEIETGRIALHPSVWVLAPVSAVLVLWSVLSMLIEPVRVRRASEAAWESAWSALLTIGGVAGLVVMALGFEADQTSAWLRPLVIVVVALVVVALAGVVVILPSVPAKIAASAVTLTALCLPSCVQLAMIVSDAGRQRVQWYVVVVLTSAGLLGVAVGWWRSQRVIWPALLVVAAASAGGWLMPAGPWLMAASVGPLLFGGAAALSAGVRVAAADPMALRFVAMALVGVVMIGAAVSIPLGWSLGGAVASEVEPARAAGRVFLGLTFAAAVMAAGYVATLTPQRQRRVSHDPGPPRRSPVGSDRS